jgi:RAC serine/threonine-protein kinase
MLDREGHIKITDFGLCKENINSGDATSTFCGTPEYLAPEVIEDSEYGQSVDWWGVGVVMFEMISGQLPFKSRDHEELFSLILTQPLKVPPFFSPNAKDLVAQLLDKDPTRRICSGPTGGEELMQHPFFSDIDWAELDKRAVPPPFVPEIKSDTDTSNFDPFFTQEVAEVTPPDAETPLTSASKKKSAFKDFKTVGP